MQHLGRLLREKGLKESENRGVQKNSDILLENNDLICYECKARSSQL